MVRNTIPFVDSTILCTFLFNALKNTSLSNFKGVIDHKFKENKNFFAILKSKGGVL
jgi:hypothetical protein